MSIPTRAIFLVLTVLALGGCNKSAVLQANAGAPARDVPVSISTRNLAAGNPEDLPLKVEQTRGALLYATHCAACHTSKIHWREKTIATDMASLRFQVRRWQSSIGLNWTEEEITDVARYLNGAYYGFPDDGQKDIPDADKPFQALRNR